MRFSLLARRWRQAVDAHLTRAGLTDATWAPLVHLREAGVAITQKDLAARLGIDGSSLVRVLDILQARGLIERRADPSDGRARLIHLTEQGEARLDEILAELHGFEAVLLQDVGDADLAAMLGAMDRIDAVLQEQAQPSEAM
ncbi:MarR family transcriptional regulator [Xinfangfangia sp. CPCC 101601]|uniref:MarR family transcriptional regulator n=1 Tax=Pseudogemmobacter lacusdianii TaxID=3069608 RepID=A0ABU0VXH2_9RHOB|nr:MarR family transcriptional regulator [Xinfangfangia sp. CPCC 101601]MDQ2066459.1 MarR family transcriptional regulator [Xinfangfangia sp. CPCC 101601]